MAMILEKDRFLSALRKNTGVYEFYTLDELTKMPGSPARATLSKAVTKGVLIPVASAFKKKLFAEDAVYSFYVFATERNNK